MGAHILESEEVGTCQDMESKQRESARLSLPGAHRGRDKSRHGKEARGRGALTNWRAQTEGQVMTQKGSNQTIGTHVLESAEGETRLGHGNGASGRGVPTPWRAQKEERVRTRNKCKRARDTHCLENRVRDKSGYRKEAGSEVYSQTGKRRGREKQVMTGKETERARCTHKLWSTKGRMSQDMERNPTSEGHPQTMQCRGRICEDAERKRGSEEHSPTGERRGRERLKHHNINAQGQTDIILSDNLFSERGNSRQGVRIYPDRRKCQ